MKNRDNDDGGVQASEIVTPYTMIKIDLLEKQEELIELYTKFRKLKRNGKNHSPSERDWFKSLEVLYLKIRGSLNKNQKHAEEYKDCIDLMEEFMFEDKNLSFDEALKCTADLINFLYDLGLTKLDTDFVDVYDQFKNTY